MRILFALLILVLVAATACAHGAPLRDRLTRAAVTPDGQGRIAVSVLDLSTGARASIHGDAWMPMMSVFKLGLAVLALDQVDHGQLKLDQRLPIAEADVDDSENMPVAAAWKKGEHAPTLEELLVWLVESSDNTAADQMLALLGGGAAATARLHALGVTGIQIVEPEVSISARLDCSGLAAPARGWTWAAVHSCPDVPEAQQAAAAQHEVAASNNIATADGLVDLLARLDRGTLLTETSRRWLFRTMERTRNGPRRLKGLLPPRTPVAHRPGTAYTSAMGMSVAINDVGIVTMPDGRRFAIAVMESGSRASFAAQEDTIARLARSAWDALLRP
jgi:beta-lactamase class A